MAYTEKMICRKCKKEFGYFILPYSNEIDEQDVNSDILKTDIPYKTQMCLDWVDADGTPEYSAYCPECGCENKMPEGDASAVPEIYFEGYRPNIE